jgi:hypothetical protein
MRGLGSFLRPVAGLLLFEAPAGARGLGIFVKDYKKYEEI